MADVDVDVSLEHDRNTEGFFTIEMSGIRLKDKEPIEQLIVEYVQRNYDMQQEDIDLRSEFAVLNEVSGNYEIVDYCPPEVSH